MAIDTTHHLLADVLLGAPMDMATPVATLQTEAQGLLNYAQTITNTGEEIMFTMDVPHVPVQDTPIVLAQAAVPGAGSSPLQPDYLLKACTETNNDGDPLTAQNGVDPAGLIALEIGNRSNRNILDDSATVASIKITMLEGTTHGKLISKTGAGRVYYMYQPDPGYLGNDKMAYLAEFEGKTYKVVLNIVVVLAVDQNSSQCPPSATLIKLNTKPVSGSSGIDLSSISLNLANLPGGAVGQTVGSNITLDTTASKVIGDRPRFSARMTLT